MQMVHRYETGKHGAVNALAVTPEDCMIGACSDGCMLVFAPRASYVQSKFNLGAAPMQNLQADSAPTTV